MFLAEIHDEKPKEDNYAIVQNKIKHLSKMSIVLLCLRSVQSYFRKNHLIITSYEPSARSLRVNIKPGS